MKHTILFVLILSLFASLAVQGVVPAYADDDSDEEEHEFHERDEDDENEKHASYSEREYEEAHEYEDYDEVEDEKGYEFEDEDEDEDRPVQIFQQNISTAPLSSTPVISTETSRPTVTTTTTVLDPIIIRETQVNEYTVIQDVLIPVDAPVQDQDSNGIVDAVELLFYQSR